MPKKIVFCADGTWNSPRDAQSPRDGCTPELTNVCKLFGWLDGETNGSWGRPEMEKTCVDATGTTTQIAKYIHGVGDSTQVDQRLVGGLFGVGVVARIARGYTYISRNYVAGDSIVLVGFSRGAYTVRALAGLILSQGLLKPSLATDPANKYDNAAAAWYRYRHGTDTNVFQRAIDTVLQFAGIWSEAHFQVKHLSDDDFVPVDGLSAVAVWDTVGALGIPICFGDRPMPEMRRDVVFERSKPLACVLTRPNGLNRASVVRPRDAG